MASLALRAARYFSLAKPSLMKIIPACMKTPVRMACTSTLTTPSTMNATAFVRSSSRLRLRFFSSSHAHPSAVQHLRRLYTPRMNTNLLLQHTHITNSAAVHTRTAPMCLRRTFTNYSHVTKASVPTHFSATSAMSLSSRLPYNNVFGISNIHTPFAQAFLSTSADKESTTSDSVKEAQPVEEPAEPASGDASTVKEAEVKQAPEPPVSNEAATGPSESYTFQSESKRILDIVANSLYTDKEVCVCVCLIL